MTKQGFLTAKCSLLTQGEIPEWIEILPAPDTQGRIIGRDGRWWSCHNPQVVVDAFGRVPVFGDFEHASEHTYGEPAPATAWVEALEVRPAVATTTVEDGVNGRAEPQQTGAIWAKVAWTAKASEMIKNKEYRFISPVFNYTIDNKEITEILSFGLTNQPNLELRALNRYGNAFHATAVNTRLMGNKSPIPDPNQKGKIKMKTICKALGLTDEASEDAILTAINTLIEDKATALNKADSPPIDKFIPKADYDVAVNKAETAEKALNDISESLHSENVEKAVNKALEDGKITPATVDYHKASCKTAENLKNFEDTFANAPTVMGRAGEATAANKTGTDASALTTEEKSMCKAMNVSETDFINQRNEEGA